MSNELDKPKNPVPPQLVKHHEHPLTTASLRQQLLEAAGYDHDYQVRLMGKVIQGAEADLDATKETPTFYMGKLGDVHTQADYPARAKARDQLVDIIGANEKTANKPQQARPDIPLPPWMLNMTFNNTQPVVVSDVTNTPHMGSAIGSDDPLGPIIQPSTPTPIVE